MSDPRFIIDRRSAVRRLELVRRASGLNKGAFSESLSMHPSNYSRILKGEFFLTADQLYTFWRLYGVCPCYIMDGSMCDMPGDLRSRIEAVADAERARARA